MPVWKYVEMEEHEDGLIHAIEESEMKKIVSSPFHIFCIVAACHCASYFDFVVIIF